MTQAEASRDQDQSDSEPSFENSLAPHVYKTRRAVLLVMLIIATAAGTFWGIKAANSETEAAHSRWGKPFWGSIISTTPSGNGYSGVKVAFSERGGKAGYVNTSLPSSWKINDQVKLWQAGDGAIFVQSSYIFDRDSSEEWRDEPWPTTQGAFFGRLFIAIALAIAAYVALVAIIMPRRKPLFTEGKTQDEEGDGP